MSHPASAGLRELADKLDGLAVVGHTPKVILLISPNRSQWSPTAAALSAKAPTIHGEREPYAFATADVVGGCGSPFRCYLQADLKEIGERTTSVVTTYKLPEVQS